MPRNNRKKSTAASGPEITNINTRSNVRQGKQQNSQPEHQPKQQQAPKKQPRNKYLKRQKIDGFEVKKCINWFKRYTTEDDPDTLGPEGMEKFCNDVGVKPDNIVMLALAYKMGASQMCFFTKSEWTKGLTDLQCDDASKFQSKLHILQDCLNDTDTFKEIYKYTFDFAKEDKMQRYLDVEIAKPMLQLLLEKNWPLYPKFVKFLDSSTYKTINRDQWWNIFKFSTSIKTDLSNYDIIEGSWPVLLDEFVLWLDPTHGEESAYNK